MDPSEFIVVEYIDEMDQNSGPTEEKDLYKCPYCPKAFESTAAYNKHIRSHDDKRGLRKKTCKLCNYVTTIDEELTKHVEFAHSKEILTLNGRRIKSKHTRDAAVECKFCGVLLDTNTTYYEHAKTEHLEQVQKEWQLCDSCDSYFPEYADLLLHKNVRHAQRNDRDENECDICGEVFPEDYSYLKHANKVHEHEVSQLWLPCDRCSMFLPSPKILSRHKVQRHFHEMVPQRKITKSQLLQQIDVSSQPKPILQSPLGPKPRTKAEQALKVTIASSGMPLLKTEANQKEVMFFKQEIAEDSVAPERKKKSADGPPAKRAKKDVAKSTNEEDHWQQSTVSTSSDGGIVYVISQSGSDATFLLPEDQQSNHISGIKVENDSITFQVKEN